MVIRSAIRSAVRSAVYSPVADKWGAGGITIESLNPVLQIEPFTAGSLFQERTGASATTAASSDADAIGTAVDQSASGLYATTVADSRRPLYKESGAVKYMLFDGVDDNLTVTFASDVTGTMMIGTTTGIIHAEVDISAGAWSFSVDARYFHTKTITGMLLFDDVLTDPQVAAVNAYLQVNGAGANFAGTTSMENWFRNRSDVTAIYMSEMDLSSVNNLTTFAFDCDALVNLDMTGCDTSNVEYFVSFINRSSGIVTLDMSDLDTSSAISFLGFANLSTSLTNVIVTGGAGSPFSDSPCTNYTSAFTSTNLSQTSIDNILVAIAAAGTSSGTFDQSGGSAPSATGEAAIDTLRGRSWTISVTGGY